MDNLGKPAMLLMKMGVRWLTGHIQLTGCLIHLCNMEYGYGIISKMDIDVDILDSVSFSLNVYILDLHKEGGVDLYQGICDWAGNKWVTFERWF